MKDPCPDCPRREVCTNEGGSRVTNCREWPIYFRERWAYIHGYAIAHGVQPTTPPEEVTEDGNES